MNFSIERMTVAYDRTVVVDDVSVEFAAGRMAAIVGPNGAGKSTLIKAALGLVPRLSGVVRAGGQPFEGGDPRVGYVPQRESVDWDFPVSVLDVAIMGCYGRVGWTRRVPRQEVERARQSLASVGMLEYEKRQIGQLSGGQQQRTFLARALTQDAAVYLLDEPFAGVDATTEAAMVQVLKRLRDDGRAVVAVHHDLDSVDEVFDDVLLLNRRAVAFGPVSEVFTPEALHHTYHRSPK